MGEPIKQLDNTYDDNLIVPEVLVKTVQNFKKAHYGYKFDDKEQAYIDYNTLREQQKDTEEITIKKIQRLTDRDSQKEHIVYFQESRVRDLNNNYVKCPIVEKIGVAPRPIANVSNDSRVRIKDVTIIETENDYYIPFSKEKLIELFESSKDRHKIVCYAGYTRPTRVNPSDTIDSKKIIWNQDKFVTAEFSELMDKDPDVQEVLDERTQFIIPNKVRDLNSKAKSKSQRVESLADLLPNKNKSKVEQENIEVNDQLSGVSGNKIVNDTEKEFKELMNKD